MSRNRYWVVWASSIEKWQVKKTGATTALKNSDTKELAVSYGVSLAKNNMPSQLTIKRKDDTIEDERTYAKDPYPHEVE